MKKYSIILVYILSFILVFNTIAFCLPKGFVDVQTIIPDLAVDLRYLGSNNFVGRPIKGYEGQRVILTKEAAQALAQVQNELRKLGLGLLVYDAYRPVKAVEDFVAWSKDLSDTKTKSSYYPDLEKHELFEQGYIYGIKSSHSRGSTVDVTIIPLYCDNTYKPCTHYFPLDMGSCYDFFSEISHSDYTNLTPQQRANRLLLQTIMKKHNFIPLKEEWWHFTLANEPFPDTYFNFPVK